MRARFPTRDLLGNRIKCDVPGCDRDRNALGLCRAHRDQMRAGKQFTAIGERPAKRAVACGDPSGCQSPAAIRGLCKKHYNALRYRERKSGAPKRGGIRVGTPCLRCGDPSISVGLCREHYNESRRRPGAKYRTRIDALGNRLPCTVDGCERPVHSNMLCNAHYQSMSRTPAAARIECPLPGCTAPMYATQTVCRNHNRLMWRYSLTFDRCLEMFQNYRCSNRECMAVEGLHIDHDHACCDTRVGSRVSCGKCVRGWLCSRCNRTLGAVRDDAMALRGLVEFLERTTNR